MNPDPVAIQLEALIHTFQNNWNLIEVTSAYRWSDIGWHVTPETSEDFEIKYVARGQAVMKLSSDTFPLQTGDLIFLDNYRGHHCDQGIFTIFSFGFKIHRSTPAGKLLYNEVQSLFEKMPQKLKLGIHGRMIRRYSELSKEISLRSYGYDANLKCWAIQLLIEVVRICLVIRSSATNITPYQYNKYTDLVSDIIDYLEENVGNLIDLQELGRKYMLNPKYLNRIFKGTTGSPIYRYHQMIKIKKAKNLLSASNLNLLDIAMELGFESSQSFSKFYKKMTLITPSEYRKMLKKDTRDHVAHS